MDYRLKNVQLENGEIIKLQIWDTSGQERFKSIARAYFKGAHAIILIFSIIDKKSFENVQNWVNQIKEETTEKTLLILIGNKINLEDEREIMKNEGEELAKEFDINYYECSAKTGENINLAFDELIKKIVKTFDRTKNRSTKLISGNKGNKKGNSCCKK